MLKEMEVLCAVWPESIPATDYGRAVQLLRAAGLIQAAARATLAELPRQMPAPVARTRRRSSATDVIREVLSHGPMSAKDLAAAAKRSTQQTYRVLRNLGAVPAGSASRPSDAVGPIAVLWALPPEK